ncbi:ParA family protein [Calidifontibacter terrae]
MTTYAVANGKGGVAKSTTAAELLAACARAGRTALGIDLDQQGNFSARVGIGSDTDLKAGAVHVITAEATLREAAVPAPSVPGAHIVVGSHDLTNLDPTSTPDLITGLRDDLRAGGVPWDDIVIDAPPSLDRLALTALVAAEVVIAPTTCEWDGVEQLARLEAVLQTIGRRLRPGARLDWIVPTMYDPRTRRPRDVIDQLRQTYGPEHVTAPIRRSVRVGDAYDAGQPVSIYSPREGVAQDYVDVLGHIIRSTTGVAA